MKILYLTIAYSIDKNGLYQNLIDSLIKRNHEVTIVRSKYDIEKTVYEKLKPGVYGLSVKTGNPFEHNLIKKGLNQVFLAHYFKNAINKFLKSEQFDLILYGTPPVTLARVVKYCKMIYGAKTFLMLKDIFPQNAVDLEMIKQGSLIYKYFRVQEKKYYCYSDYIGCMSDGNKEYVLHHNPSINCSKVDIFPNSIAISELNEITFHQEKTVFMFGGNLGKPQNIPLLLNVITQLKSYKKAEFIIVGNGKEASTILEFCDKNSVPSLKYINEVSQKEYEEILKSVDVGLISLDPRFTIPNIPSKFQTYLKLKKPVFAMTDRNTDLKEMIEDHECGWWCAADNEAEIIRTIKYICENKEEQIQKGKNGFEYLKQEFDVEKNVDKIEAFMGV